MFIYLFICGILQLSSVIDPYQFQLNLVDIERNLAPVPGSQELSDLSQFPRLRLFGNSSFEVSTNSVPIHAVHTVATE